MHRNSQKRIHIPDAAYFVTVKTRHNEPYFREPIFCQLFVEQLRVAKSLKSFELYGWFFGCDHFHMVVRPRGKWNLSGIMFSIKKQFSHNANMVMGYSPMSRPKSRNARISQFQPKANNRLFAFIGDGGSCVNHPDDSRVHAKFRDFLADIHRLDFVIIRFRTQFLLKYNHRNPFPIFRWQKSFHDHYCRNERDFRTHLEYIAHNPIKHGLPRDWPYVFTHDKYADLTDDGGF